jgi:hypothetical protein
VAKQLTLCTGDPAALLRRPVAGDNAAMENKPRSVESPMRTLRGFQFSLRTLMIGVTLLACLLAIWKKWGLLPASVVFFTSLALMLCWTRRWRQVFSTADGTVWWGGLLMWFSAFFTLAYGPMGVELTQAGRLRYSVDFSWLGIACLLTWLGIFWGATVATLAAIAIAVDATRFISQLKYVALALWLLTVAAGNFILLPIVSGGDLPARSVVALAISAATITAVTIVVRCDWQSTAKAAAVQIVGALSLLFGIVPIRYPGRPFPDLAIYGMGFWMYCAGIVLVIAASAWALKKAPINARSDVTH